MQKKFYVTEILNSYSVLVFPHTKLKFKKKKQREMENLKYL